MRVAEALVAALCVGMGVRSLVYWLRRPFEDDDTVDLALFALFVMGRAGLWFAVGAMFAIYAWIGTRGQAFLDDVARFDWFIVVFAALAAVQVVAGFLLGRRTPQP